VEVFIKLIISIKFAKEFGGKVVNFKEALALAKADFKSDTKAKNMRQAMAAKKGALVYKKMCKAIDKKFTTVAEAKNYIKSSGVCGNIKGKPLQAVGLYLLKR